MFLTKNNQMKWRTLGWGTVVTLGLCLAGIFVLDQPLYLFLRGFDCGLFRFFGDVFRAKVWLVVTAALVVAFYIKKTVVSKYNLIEKIKNFKFYEIFIDFIEKTKTSNALFIFCSIFSSCLLAGGLKVVLGRARPIFFEALGMTGFYPFTFDWAFNSMPSGHTVASFAGLVMVGMLAPRIKGLTWGLAILIGVSRVCVGAHWPSDVLLGAFIGMVMADLVKWRLMRRIAK